MTKYIQTNESGYVTGVVEEELIVGLFGGTSNLKVSDDDAQEIKGLLKIYHSRGDGLHLDDVLKKIQGEN